MCCRSERDMQDCIGFRRVLFQHFYSFACWEDKQFDLATHSFTLHFFHDRQRAGAGTDHEPATFPGNLFLHGQRRVSKGVAEWLGRFFLALYEQFRDRSQRHARR